MGKGLDGEKSAPRVRGRLGLSSFRIPPLEAVDEPYGDGLIFAERTAGISADLYRGGRYRKFGSDGRPTLLTQPFLLAPIRCLL